MLKLLVIDETKKLILECEHCTERFFKMREEDRAPHFFEEVKPHADQIHGLLHSWQANANEWIKQKRPKYMHPQQIASTVEAMDQFVVQSFYKETSKKRFIQSVQSTSYTLNTFLHYLEEGEHDVVKKADD